MFGSQACRYGKNVENDNIIKNYACDYRQNFCSIATNLSMQTCATIRIKYTYDMFMVNACYSGIVCVGHLLSPHHIGSERDFNCVSHVPTEVVKSIGST